MPENDEAPESDLPFASAPIPRHIAMIMDGNGRWARARGRPRVFGHRAGAESVRVCTRACGRWGVGYLTLYAFSSENWARPDREVNALMKLLDTYLKKELRALDENNVILNAIGDLDRLPREVRRQLDHARTMLADNDGLTLTLALSYGSRDEIVRATRSLAQDVAAGRLRSEEIDEAAMAARLDTANLPDPDLMIRTAGEMRLSNFLLWQSSYAEYYAADVCWPDFGEDELAKAIRCYQARVRKYGRVVET